MPFGRRSHFRMLGGVQRAGMLVTEPKSEALGAQTETTAAIGIVDLLTRAGLDTTNPTRMVRHQDPGRYDVHELRRSGWLELYQGFQRRKVFDDCSQIVSFMGDVGTRARFVGVYRVAGRRASTDVQLPPGFPHAEWRTDSKYFYDLRPLGGFENLRDRVIIDWGKATRQWVQHLRNKDVLEILSPGGVRDPFTDYLEFTLSFDELKQIVDNPEANREWRSRLSAVAGIYLIVASKNGAQYVGSAHGTDGVWGRWAMYATNGHGGNKHLKSLIRSDPDYPRAFRYTLLQILPKTFTRNDVVEWENRYKRKLGTRATGLNAN